MSKKRNSKKRKKNPKPSADFLEKKILNIFNKQINKVFSTKQLLKKLNVSNSIDAINSALEKLDKAGKIKTIAEGKYKWKKNSSRALDTP
jgi:ribosomal protein S25